MANLMLLAIGLAACLSTWLAFGKTDVVSGRSNSSEGLIQCAVEVLNRYARLLPAELVEAVPLSGIGTEFVYVSLAAGYRLERGASALLVCLLVSLGALAGLVVSQSAIGLCAGALVAAVALSWWAGSHERARAQSLAAQVPDIYRSLSGALSSGRTLAQAISYVGAAEQGPLQREFGRAALMVSCGVSAVDALRELPERVHAPGIDLMVTALSISARTGAPLQELFARSARMVERRFELERELGAKTAQVRLSARLVGAMPVAMVCLLALLSPDFREGLATPLGTGCVAVAIILDVLALVIIRRLMVGVV